MRIGSGCWQGEYFRDQLPINNSSSAIWTNITVSAAGQSPVSGNLFVAQTPEVFGYDADGNLTNDGRWGYTWDAENRLITMTANTSVGPQQSIAFSYDWQGRRIQKIVSTWISGAYVPQSTNRFLYDGWNLVAELGAANAPLRTYVWGLDLSGSAQGAGGVGGLLEMTYYGSQTTNCFAAYDGNGNVSALVNATDGTLAAQYEYGPFGELLRATGPMARLNPLRFSTKCQDDETELLYYGHRYYNAMTGRWLARDPLGEVSFLEQYSAGKDELALMRLGAESLTPSYVFLRNSPASSIDPSGLDRWLFWGVHSYLVVEQWDNCGKKTGYCWAIEFGPAMGWGLFPIPLGWQSGQVTIEGVQPPSGSWAWNAPYEYHVTHYDSDCEGDRDLYNWAQQEKKNPPHYSILFFNCNDFAEEGLMNGMTFGGE